MGQGETEGREGALGYRTRRMRRVLLATALDHELVINLSKEFMDLYNGILFLIKNKLKAVGVLK